MKRQGLRSIREAIQTAGSMRKGVLRALVTIAVLTVIWLAAAPAFASTPAPVCDPRGAIGFAPPPQLQDLEQSIDVDPDVDCAATKEPQHVTGSRSPQVDSSSAQEPVACGGSPRVVASRGERVAAPASDASAGARGIERTIERPPRA